VNKNDEEMKKINQGLNDLLFIISYICNMQHEA
jgi:hypothetical protein